MLKYLILLLIICSSKVFAISEEGYLNTFTTQVWPYFQSFPEKKLPSFDNTLINYRYLALGNRDLVIVMGGRTEPIDKYAELAFDLKDVAVDLLSIDSRGQGRSERLLKDPQKGYVKNFEDYAKDLKFLIDNLKLRNQYRKVIFLAHSMGGAIGLQAQILYPKLFDGMILSVPMIEILLRGRSESGTLKLTKLLKLIGMKRSYIPGGGQVEDYWSFEENTVTQSLERHNMAHWLTVNDRTLLMGSSTVNWVYEAIKAGRFIFKKRENISELPILMFQAQHENFSRYSRQNKMCASNPHCKRVYIFGSKHEVFMEKDEFRNIALKETKIFLEKIIKN
ncbi:alpha/beta fold hydrolase [Bacteriovoracaceae bacterium]|nr:alpha/beta fold hydrolase [Bacteriovoracaceae bacterium]